jgi:hypothetical protein
LKYAAALFASLWVGAAAAADVHVFSLSNRADLLSGGDALIAIDNVDPSSVRVELDGADVTGAFALRPNNRFEGKLSGMSDGAHVLRARRPDGTGARLDLVSHPAHGPVFSGTQVLPWICDTEAANLGPSQSPFCEVAAPVYTWAYKQKTCVPTPLVSIDTGEVNLRCALADYDPDSPPADVDTTTNDRGETVPFIVRIETGVIDRGIYKIAILYDPAQPDYLPWAPQRGYAGKVLMTFGGDCTPRHGQGQPIEVKDVRALGRGFAVMTSNLNILGHACNDAVNAESLVMLKEHFIETYGEIRYTLANGASGGSIQQQVIAANYPGLLDGIQPAASFPDIWEVVYEAQDCHLLDHVFTMLSPQLWLVPEQQAWAAGFALPTSCLALFDNPTGVMAYARLTFDPDNPVNCQGGAINSAIATGEWADTSYVYNAQTNPGGVRCTIQDYGVAMWGRRASDGFANRAFDNVGVQYGRQALESGQISTDQFVDLNEKAGGLDIDWNFTPERSQADPAALVNAYRGGRINRAAGMARVPVMDLRGQNFEDIHTDVHSYTMRARLEAAHGSHDNQVIWTGLVPLLPDPNSFSQSFSLLDRWVAAIEADTAPDPRELKVLRNKPAEAVDACWIAGEKITDLSLCGTVFPYFGTPRLAAGAPASDDVLKCQLKPLRREDYGVSFSDAQWQRLQATFAGGVCDYSVPGVGMQPVIEWASYARVAGGEPMGPPPESVAFGASAPATATDTGRFGGALAPMLLLGLVGLRFLHRTKYR